VELVLFGSDRFVDSLTMAIEENLEDKNYGEKRADICNHALMVIHV
jgi:hypothetical protein